MYTYIYIYIYTHIATEATSRAPVRHKSLTNALTIKDSQIYKETGRGATNDNY